mgnify:CR=1 FL=1
MFGIGFSELLMSLLIGLLLFGANRLPEIGKNIGEGIREFKNAAKGSQEDDKKNS